MIRISHIQTPHDSYNLLISVNMTPDSILNRQTPLMTSIGAVDSQTWHQLEQSSILLTGATGFFGIWMLHALDVLNKTHGISFQVHAVSRDPLRFLMKHPEFKDLPWLNWVASDVCDLRLQLGFSPGHIIHMAASSDARDYLSNPGLCFLNILKGTEATLAIAKEHQSYFHFVSSGAVYGSRTHSLGPCMEGQESRAQFDRLNPHLVYTQAKTAAESLVASSYSKWSISRPFAFLGPHLPLDQHFATGNFIHQATLGRPILIKGDGSPFRSYMHPADLVAWTLAICAKKPLQVAINVGSNQAFDLHHWAQLIQSLAPHSHPVNVLQTPSLQDPSAYWPDVSIAEKLGLKISVPITDMIINTLEWAETIKK